MQDTDFCMALREALKPCSLVELCCVRPLIAKSILSVQVLPRTRAPRIV